MPKVLIAGCGFVGKAAAFLLKNAQWEVTGLVSSAESISAQLPNPFPIIPCDIGDASAVDLLQTRIGPVDVVIHCASSGKGGVDAYRHVYRNGMQNLLSAFGSCAKTFFFTSSTSVYAQIDGSIVTEKSDTYPIRETGRILLEAEALTLKANGYVLRLAGIYGPHRSVYLRRFLNGEATMEGEGYRWLNQIHRDDAAAALFHLLDSQPVRGIYNVCDNTPATEREIYTWLAEFFKRPLPSEGTINLDRKRGWTNKRVSNAKLRATGWYPCYPSYREGMQSLI